MTRRRTLLADLFAAGTLLAAPLLFVALTPEDAHAAEFTDLLDAADDFDDLDESTWDPFDFNIEPSFQYHYSRAKIAREAPCVPEEPFADVPDDQLTTGEARIKNNPRLVVDPGRCDEARTVYNKEMDFTGTRAQLDLKLRAGIYKDLEFHINVPYVFTNTRKLSYDNLDTLNPDNNVDAGNSSVDPRAECPNGESGRCIEREARQSFTAGAAPETHVDELDQFNAYRYFELEDPQTYVRSGFAEPSLGLTWSMFNDERDPTKANLLLGVDYTMPIVPIAKAGNTAVGRGMHELQFTIASSKKFRWVEPYFGVDYTLPISSPNSPINEIDTNNQGQVFIRPPMEGDFTIGAEFIPYEDKQKGQRYGIDLRFRFGYVSEGRDYTPMFDHFAGSECNGKTLADVLPQFDTDGRVSNPNDVGCAWVVRQPSNAENRPVYDLNDGIGSDDTYSSDGIFTVEGHGSFAGLFGLYLQPTKNFQFKAMVELEHQQEHFLTNARTGRDSENEPNDEDNTVDLEGADAAIERNPVYNPTYDSAGERFRVQAYNTWVFMATAALQF